MDKELISIVIPVFNSEKYIERCITSVLNQTYKNIEIIIINDGSKDDSETIIKNYTKKDYRIKYYSQENIGVSATRNNGINYAKGKYITFIDSDDYYETKAIEHLYNLIKSSNYDFVRGNYRLKKNNDVIKSGKIEKQIVKNYNEIYNNIFDNTLPSYTVLLLIKREFLINNNIFFDNKIRMMEDTIFYTKLFSKHPSVYIDSEIIYNYEYNQESASKSSKYYKRNLYDSIKVNKEIKNILANENYNKNNLNSSSYNIISNYLFSLYVNEEYNEWQIVLTDIISNKDFLDIEKDFSYMKQPHFFISEFLLKHRKFNLLKTFYEVRKKMSNLKGDQL